MDQSTTDEEIEAVVVMGTENYINALSGIVINNPFISKNEHCAMTVGLRLHIKEDTKIITTEEVNDRTFDEPIRYKEEM